jgi:hypothetical protein
LTPLSSLGATSRYIPYPSFLYPGENPKSFGLGGGGALASFSSLEALPWVCGRWSVPVCGLVCLLRQLQRSYGGVDLLAVSSVVTWSKACVLPAVWCGCLVWWPAKLLVEARVQRWSCSSLSSRATWPMLCIRALG